ncbi:MAG: peptidoglycan-binding protein [Phormidium sp. BM_Day4_Bin.17]|nr:peptidoglycan-binding protein [Phormidium sp. BM_Day4_Bin.17]UCJ11475.1 MAG: hypothetical protein JWS08_17185 [Phormidium sp. PBR-2020]
MTVNSNSPNLGSVPLEIHEFSTGIEVKRTASGWESGGFTGVFMNQTLNPIPQAVSDAIANGGFKLAEGASSDNPAIVGRTVTGYGEQWSVVAVVTRGKDDRGRPVSLYRYFLTQASQGIEAILRWMGRQIRVFDPFDPQTLGQPHRTQFSHQEIPLPEQFRTLLTGDIPILIPATVPCTPLIVNRLTQELQPSGETAWAYNVAALERPEYFQVICPIDGKAEGILRQAIVRSSASPPPIPGDSNIKTAIKACMNGRVKINHIQSIENALDNPNLDEKYWTKLLDKQGASQAISGGLYADRNFRLLTLKAIVIPSFLPNFLDWMDQPKQLNNYYLSTLKFQTEILNKLGKNLEKTSKISENLERGICGLIPHLVKNPQLLDAASLLLGSSTGLWSSQYRKSLYPKLENDLDLMRRHIYGHKGLSFQATEYPEWKNFLSELTSIWKFSKVKKKQYLPLAKLFEEAKTPKLAAFFYQVSKGEIHKSLFFKVSQREWQDQLFGIRIKRQMDLEDVIDIVFFANVDLGGINMNRLTAILLFAVVFVMGGVGASVISARSTNELVDERTETIRGKLTEKEQEIESWQLFEKHILRTQPALDQLRHNLNADLEAFIRDNPPGSNNHIASNPTNIFIQLLKEVLIPEDNWSFSESLKDFLNPEGEDIQRDDIQYYSMFREKEQGDTFIQAVKAYQNRNGLAQDGIIDSEGETIQKLAADIREKLR